MNKSDSIAKLASALCKVQAEIENPANTADNPFFKSKYCPLPDILKMARPLLTKHGLTIVQPPSGDGQNITIGTIIMHESGEWMEFEPLTLKADKITAQGAGSAITYGRRYSLSAILGISSEDDDDGNHASGNNDKVQGKTKATTGDKKTTTSGNKTTSIADCNCKKCGTKITKRVYDYNGLGLCMDCQKEFKDKTTDPMDNGTLYLNGEDVPF